MSDGRRPVGEEDLSAYLDGQLTPERRYEVEAAIKANPALAGIVADYRRQADLIRRLYSPILTEPVPERFLELLQSPTSKAVRFGRMAAAVAMILTSGGFGWWLGQQQPSDRVAVTDPFVRQAAASYLQWRSESSESTARTTVSMQPSLSRQPQQIPVDIAVPDLSMQGFGLVDRRMVPHDNDAAVQLTYANRSGRVISVFVATREQAERPELHHGREAGVQVTYWREGRLLFGLAGARDEAETAALADRIRNSAALAVDPRRPPGSEAVLPAGLLPSFDGKVPRVPVIPPRQVAPLHQGQEALRETTSSKM